MTPLKTTAWEANPQALIGTYFLGGRHAHGHAPTHKMVVFLFLIFVVVVVSHLT